MGGFNPFSKPKVATPPPLPAAPAPVTRSDADIAAEQEAEKKRRATQKGRAATILTGGDGVLGDDTSSGLASKKLLGG